jgi:hypothetical protein
MPIRRAPWGTLEKRRRCHRVTLEGGKDLSSESLDLVSSQPRYGASRLVVSDER